MEKQINGSFITHIVTNWSAFKKTVCNDGQLCQDLLTFGSFAFMIWFMYIAMEPILIFR